MDLQGEHVQIVVTERRTFRCPEVILERYRRMAQVAALLILSPLSLLLFACALHVPILPLFGLIGVLWLVRVLEGPLNELALRTLWPAHCRWIARRDPARLTPCVERRVQTTRSPAHLLADPDQGLIALGESRWDLMACHHIEVERANNEGRQLRLRLFQPGRAPIVVGANLPASAHDALDPLYRELPRKEGEVLLLGWDQLRELVRLLFQFNAATSAPFPLILSRIAA